MAKRRTTKPPPPLKQPLTIGDLYIMRLANGLLGSCRVVRAARPEEHWGDSKLVVACAWVGQLPPSIDHPDLRRPMEMNYHHWRQLGHWPVCAAWLTGPPPEQFTCLGNIPPSESEQQPHPTGFCYWDALPSEILAQWRWEHEREAVLAEEEINRQKREQMFEEQKQQEKEDLASMTYASFRQRKLFHDWDDPTPPNMIKAARKLMVETASKLEALGPNPDREQARAILRDCIVGFNRLDEENDHWIETVEREDICAHFYELAHLAGFDDEPDLADEWRDW